MLNSKISIIRSGDESLDIEFIRRIEPSRVSVLNVLTPSLSSIIVSLHDTHLFKILVIVIAKF